MMSNMGSVRGQGIGKHSQGTPHTPKASGQTSREGIGFGTLPVESTPKSNPLLGFEDENGGTFYGYNGERNGLQVLEEVRCTS